MERTGRIRISQGSVEGNIGKTGAEEFPDSANLIDNPVNENPSVLNHPFGQLVSCLVKDSQDLAREMSCAPFRRINSLFPFRYTSILDFF